MHLSIWLSLNIANWIANFVRKDISDIAFSYFVDKSVVEDQTDPLLH